jgi:hypothetical protein
MGLQNCSSPPLIYDIAAAMDSSCGRAQQLWITHTDATGVLLDLQDAEVLYHCRVAKLQERLNMLTQVC